MIPLPRDKVLTLPTTDALDFDAQPIQSGLGGCPWRVCVASILLNRTRRTVMQPVFMRLLEVWPNPCALAQADRGLVARLLRPLGFQHTRATRLIRFSHEFLDSDWEDLRDLPGVGPYVADAVGLVCFGCTELESGDGALVEYARRLSATRSLASRCD
jgi:A/G-specific adenine glycosylase